MKVIGVIGYSGIVGAITCDYLEKFAIVIKGSRRATSDGKRYFRVDVNDQNSLYSFCSMCDLVINCAGHAYPIIVGDNVWFGANSIVVPSQPEGITIGNNSVIAAGTVVNKDVPENVLVAGNPCRIIKTI